MLGEGDCELIRSGLLGQPVNALSSLAFIVAGSLLFRSRPMVGWAAAGVGVGSFLYHGPMPGWAEWAHDVALAWLLLAVLLERWPQVVIGSAAATGLVAALAPSVINPLTVFLAVVVLGTLILDRGDTRRLTIACIVLAGGAVINLLSRTGGPLCRAGSLWQGHAVWHLAAAGALLIWASGESAIRPRRAGRI